MQEELLKKAAKIMEHKNAVQDQKSYREGWNRGVEAFYVKLERQIKMDWALDEHMLREIALSLGVKI